MADREWRLAYPMPDVDEPATRRGLRPCMFCERAAVYEADDDDDAALAVCDRHFQPLHWLRWGLAWREVGRVAEACLRSALASLAEHVEAELKD